MKKLALLLGSLLVVGTTVAAKEVLVAPVVEEVVVAEPVVAEIVEATPALRATNFTLWTEVDNNAGSADGDIGVVYLGTTLGLATENWTYGIQGYKTWQADSDDGFASNGGRVQLDAWRAFNKEGEFKYSLGTRARFYSNFDRYYLRGKYSYGMFDGWVDYFYNSRNAAGETNSDSTTLEVMPLNMTLGPVNVGYYLELSQNVGSAAKNEVTEHQLRASFPLYAGETFRLGFEGRLGLSQDADEKAKEYKFGDYTRYGINFGVKVTENSTVDGYYVYDITDYDDNSDVKEYYGEFYLGWNYKF